MKSLELYEAGLMMSDYWNGTAGVGIFVYPINTSTRRDIVEEIISEFSNIYDHIQYTFENDMDVRVINAELDRISNELKEQISGHENEMPFKNIEELELINEDGDYEQAETPALIFNLEICED